MVRWPAAVPVCLVACGMMVLPSTWGCGGGKPAANPGQTAAAGGTGGAHGGGKAGDWCDPMPQPDDKCDAELKECMVTCDYISDRCALLVCMGSKWTYVEEEDEGAAKN